MTTQAREVLEDCRIAVDQLHDGIAGREWRIAWVTCVALLRAVGHALRNVDSRSSPGMARAIEAAWSKLARTKPNPKIFWQFIEEERNNILKEYRLTAGLAITLRPGTAHCNIRTGEQWGEPGLPTLYDYAMRSGPYEGFDQRRVLSEAIDWWDSYLRSIEAASATDT